MCSFTPTAASLTRLACRLAMFFGLAVSARASTLSLSSARVRSMSAGSRPVVTDLIGCPPRGLSVHWDLPQGVGGLLQAPDAFISERARVARMAAMTAHTPATSRPTRCGR